MAVPNENTAEFEDCPVCGLAPTTKRGTCLAEGCRGGMKYGRPCSNCNSGGNTPGGGCPKCGKNGKRGIGKIRRRPKR